MKETTISISIRTILTTLLVVLGVFFLYQIRDIAISFFLALIIMSALNPGVTWFEKKHVPRTLGILILYLFVIMLLALLFTVVVPPLSKEISRMIQSLEFTKIPLQLDHFSLDIKDLGPVINQFGQSISSVISVISTTFSSIFFIFTLLVMSFYLLSGRKTLHENIIFWKHPEKWDHLLKEFIDTIEVQLGGWVRGEIMLMLSIGIITYVVLSLLSIPFALPLAVIAGLLEILPNIGPTISAVPAIAVAFLFVSPTMAAIVCILYVLIQQVENSLLVPKVMKAAVNVEPLTSILLILIGAKLHGVSGALLAIPLYIVVRSGMKIFLRETGRA